MEIRLLKLFLYTVSYHTKHSLPKSRVKVMLQCEILEFCFNSSPAYLAAAFPNALSLRCQIIPIFSEFRTDALSVLFRCLSSEDPGVRKVQRHKCLAFVLTSPWLRMSSLLWRISLTYIYGDFFPNDVVFLVECIPMRLQVWCCLACDGEKLPVIFLMIFGCGTLS